MFLSEKNEQSGITEKNSHNEHIRETNDSEDLFEEYYDEKGEINICPVNSRGNPSVEDQNFNSNISESGAPSCSSQSGKSLDAKISPLSSNLRLPPIVLGTVNSRKGKVFVKWPLARKGQDFVVPQPYPERFIKDRWDENHVRMPCSTQSQFPVMNSQGVKELKNRWELIEKALSTKIQTANEFEERVMSYNRAGRWSFNGFRDRFGDDEEQRENEIFFNEILPEICDLALKLPFVLTAPIPLLRKGSNQSLTFSQFQIASLLANAFFCTFPRRNATGRQTEYSNFPIINFNSLFGAGDVNGEKLSCLINYFRRVTREQPPKGVVTFKRRSIHSSMTPRWQLSTKRLLKLKITSNGTIEDNGTEMLQVREVVFRITSQHKFALLSATAPPQVRSRHKLSY